MPAGGLQSWISTANNNTTTPGAGGAFWIPLNGSGRQILASTTNFYVAPSGNDSTGNGTSGAPWLTLQHAYNYIAQNVDIAGQQCIVNAADNTNYAPLLANIPTVGGPVIFIGDTTTPTNCVINSTSGDCFSGSGNGISLFVKGFSTISNTGSGDGGVSALQRCQCDDQREYELWADYLAGSTNICWFGRRHEFHYCRLFNQR